MLSGSLTAEPRRELLPCILYGNIDTLYLHETIYLPKAFTLNTWEIERASFSPMLQMRKLRHIIISKVTNSERIRINSKCQMSNEKPLKHFIRRKNFPFFQFWCQNRVSGLVVSEVPWWLSGLRIWHCNCFGSGYWCDEGLTLGQRIFECWPWQKKKKKKLVVSALISVSFRRSPERKESSIRHGYRTRDLCSRSEAFHS